MATASFATGLARASTAPRSTCVAGRAGRGRHATARCDRGAAAERRARSRRQRLDEVPRRGWRRPRAVPASSSSASRAASSAQVRASCPKVGSSSTSSRGRVASAVATDSRRCSPPDERERVGPRQVRQPQPLEQLVDARRTVSPAATPARRGPSASSSATVAATNWCRGSWNTEPIRRTRSPRPPAVRLAARSPSASAAGASSVARHAGRASPAERERQGRLAARRWARPARSRTGAHVEVARRRAPAGRVRAPGDRDVARPAAAVAGGRSPPPAARDACGCAPAPTRPRRRARRRARPSTSRAAPSATTPPPGSSTTTRSTSVEPGRHPVLDHQAGRAGRRRAPRPRPTQRAAPPGRASRSARRAAARPGRRASTPASASRCRSPAGQARGRSGRARRRGRRRRRASRTRGQISRDGHGVVLQAERDVVAAPRQHGLGLRVLQQQAGAARPPDPRTARVRRLAGAGRRRAAARPPARRCRARPPSSRPARPASSVDLPAPLGPSSSTRSPRLDVEVDAADRPRRRPACRQPQPRRLTAGRSRAAVRPVGRPGPRRAAASAPVAAERPGERPAAEAGDHHAGHDREDDVDEPCSRARSPGSRRSVSSRPTTTPAPAPASSAVGRPQPAVQQQREHDLGAQPLEQAVPDRREAPLVADQRAQRRRRRVSV